RADAAAEHNCTRCDTKIGEDAEDVAPHVVEPERRVRFGRTAPSAQVHGDGSEAYREPLDLVKPQVVIERQRVDEHQRRATPRPLLIDWQPVFPAGGAGIGAPPFAASN